VAGAGGKQRLTRPTARCARSLISPVFGDLSGLPPLIIQAGTHEVLLDDAVRLEQAAQFASESRVTA
jgi:acetyl esterase/lipase